MMSIPVVDISHWSGAVEDSLVQQIHDAFTTVGFVFITGHGIPRERVSYCTYTYIHVHDVSDSDRESHLHV